MKHKLPLASSFLYAEHTFGRRLRGLWVQECGFLKNCRHFKICACVLFFQTYCGWPVLDKFVPQAKMAVEEQVYVVVNFEEVRFMVSFVCLDLPSFS